MRDFRDAKAMAQTLREYLSHKAMTISHSESLELVSKMFGAADWNALSAQIQAGREGPAKPAAGTGAASYPVMPIRDFVPFPGAMVPLFVGRERTIRALDHAFQRQREVVLAVQKNPAVNEPGIDDVYEVGVLAGILELRRLSHDDLQVLRFADGTLKVLTQVYRRVAIRRLFGEAGAFLAEIADLVEGPIPDAPDLVLATLGAFRTYANAQNIDIEQLWPVLKQVRNPGRVADMISGHLKVPIKDKQSLLATIDPVARLERVIALLKIAL
ncbi:MAG TPA: LON peptidase substrate-binding domain-containing protein [Steroidobacteraceae bacterium]|jgi:ATP-dependent Lon protease|nr:LON peptidase substrate-binding domain-containing protein [Steroidobacteraceae bacterium]